MFARFLSEGRFLGAPARLFAALFLATPLTSKAIFSPSATSIRRESGRVLLPATLMDSDEGVTPLRRRKAVDVYLPRNAVFKRTVMLPVSTTGRIDEALRLDLLRSTPFDLAKIFFARSGVRRVGDAIEVEQWVAKKPLVSGLAARLSRLKIDAMRVFVEGADLALPIADFSGPDRSRQRVWRLLNLSIILAAVAIALLRWLGPVWTISQELETAEAELVTLRQSTIELRAELDGRLSEATEVSLLAGQVLLRPSLVATLDTLSGSLPDEVWLTDLTFAGSEVTLAGQSSISATSLVLELSGSNDFETVELTGPIARVAGGEERFELSVGLKRPQ